MREIDIDQGRCPAQPNPLHSTRNLCLTKAIGGTLQVPADRVDHCQCSQCIANVEIARQVESEFDDLPADVSPLAEP